MMGPLWDYQNWERLQIKLIVCNRDILSIFQIRFGHLFGLHWCWPGLGVLVLAWFSLYSLLEMCFSRYYVCLGKVKLYLRPFEIGLLFRKIRYITVVHYYMSIMLMNIAYPTNTAWIHGFGDIEIQFPYSLSLSLISPLYTRIYTFTFFCFGSVMPYVFRPRTYSVWIVYWCLSYGRVGHCSYFPWLTV